MSEPTEDYRYLSLYPFVPADEASRQRYDVLRAQSAAHRALHTVTTADARHDYVLLVDAAGRWGLDGGPPLVTVHIHRDLQTRTAAIERAEHPTLAAAQEWFADRGMTTAPVVLADRDGDQLADGLSVEVDHRLREVHPEYALVPGSSLRHHDPRRRYLLFEPTHPTSEVRWLVWRSDLAGGYYRLRETHLPNAHAARQWLTDHGFAPATSQTRAPARARTPRPASAHKGRRR
ncbi:hypothetical protein AN219_37465 [Streptomyces nanshensis]|nr:hypothetical protein AN219_37465 [Streptomyces nanshensis]